MKIKLNKLILLVLCSLFFIAFATLALIKHGHFLSGYDLAIVDQIVWKYSQFKLPITTIHAYAFTSLLSDHVEIIYILLSPFYWLYNCAVTLIVLQTFFVSFSAIPVYLLAKRKKLPSILGLSLVISYLSFYGLQNALWFDVHSLAFGVSFLAWFIYFLDKNHKIGVFVSLILALLCKEDMGLLTFFIGFLYLITTRNKIALISMGISAFYVGTIFFVYFPFFTQDGYRYAAPGGLFSDLKFSYLFDTIEKKQVYFYSFAWFGFLPLLAIPYLLPALADISHYFLFGHSVVTSAQGLFMHYRISLAILLVWPTIIVLGKIISRYKRPLVVNLLAAYLLFCALIGQYVLHEPLSYLTKRWFWTQPKSVVNINRMLKLLPKEASIVTQVNITPHITHRVNVFTLWPQRKNFKTNSPCGKLSCNWFRWVGKPQYLLVDTSSDWDARHFLTDRETFIDGVNNLEKAGVIVRYKQEENTVLYKVIKSN